MWVKIAIVAVERHRDPVPGVALRGCVAGLGGRKAMVVTEKWVPQVTTTAVLKAKVIWVAWFLTYQTIRSYFASIVSHASFNKLRLRRCKDSKKKKTQKIARNPNVLLIALFLSPLSSIFRPHRPPSSLYPRSPLRPSSSRHASSPPPSSSLHASSPPPT